MKTIITFFLFSITSFSQISYGLKAGALRTSSTYSSTSFEVTANASTNSGTGFYFGGFLDKPINKKGDLLLSTGLQFKQINTSFNKTTKNDIGYSPIYGQVEVTTDFFDSQISISSIQIPLLLKFKATDKFSLSGGIYAGAIVNFKTSVKEEPQERNLSKPNFKSTDVGLLIETSYDFSSIFFVELKYEKGFTNLSSTKIDVGFTTLSDDFKTQSIGIGLGYKFK